MSAQPQPNKATDAQTDVTHSAQPEGQSDVTHSAQPEGQSDVTHSAQPEGQASGQAAGAGRQGSGQSDVTHSAQPEGQASGQAAGAGRQGSATAAPQVPRVDFASSDAALRRALDSAQRSVQKTIDILAEASKFSCHTPPKPEAPTAANGRDVKSADGGASKTLDGKKLEVMEEKLYVSDAKLPGGAGREFRILQYNIDRAVPHEKTNPFEARSKRIQALIEDVDADIVNLQELRELPNTTPVMTWLGSFAPKYRYVVGFRNPGPLAFGQAILYKPDRLFPLEQTVKWMSDTPNVVSNHYDPAGFGNIIVSARFAAVQNDKIIKDRGEARTFWVDNLHFPLDETAKMACCKMYVRFIKDRAEPTVMSGDLNFFPDKDGDKQRKVLVEEAKLADFGLDQVTLVKAKPCVSTFVGFDCDPFKSPLDADVHNRLDHIMSTPEKGIVPISPVTLWTKTMLPDEPPELSTRDMPSDHLPLVATFRICSVWSKCQPMKWPTRPSWLNS